MILDTLAIIKESNSDGINWWELIIQSSIIMALFGIAVEFIRRKFQKELEFLKNEFTIIQTTFSKNYDIILNYYTYFLNHYRICQRIVNCDIIDYPDKESIHPENIFMNELDTYVNNINSVEAKLKIIFPKKLIDIYEESITAFNEFRDIVKSYYSKNSYTSKKPNKELVDKFKDIDKIKKDLEKEIKKYLRTEKLYSN